MKMEALAIFLLPWCLDLLAGRGVQATLFGASLWGCALMLSLARAQIRQALWRNRLGVVLAFCLGAWIAYWFFSLNHPPGLRDWNGDALRWLTLLHASFLSAAFAVIFVLLVFSIFWLVQERALKKTSWERRVSNFGKKLPSLEACSRVTQRAHQLVLYCWSFGFFLAATSLIIRQRVSGHATPLSWAGDPQFQITLGLFLVLLLSSIILHFIGRNRKLPYLIHILLAVIFFLAFICLKFVDHQSFHEPLRWF